MKIPWSKRKKALLIIDVQSGFIRPYHARTLKNIKRLLSQATYDLYIETVFYAPKNSLWNKQTGWYLPKDSQTITITEIKRLIPSEHSLHLEKKTKSAFKGNLALDKELRKRKIKELHVIGLDTNDCVLATAYEAFDLGYITYAIEECTHSSGSNRMKKAGLTVLRHVNLTNNSAVEDCEFRNIH